MEALLLQWLLRDQLCTQMGVSSDSVEDKNRALIPSFKLLTSQAQSLSVFESLLEERHEQHSPSEPAQDQPSGCVLSNTTLQQ